MEADPNDGLLTPANVAGQRNLTPRAALAGKGMTGFDPKGSGTDLATDASEEAQNRWTGPMPIRPPTRQEPRMQATTRPPGGTGEQLERQRFPAEAAVRLSPRKTRPLGTYGSPGGTGHLVSAWYQMPKRSADRPLITMSVAGQVEYIGDLSVTHKGQTVRVEYGRVGPTVRDPVGRRVPMDTDHAPSGATCGSRSIRAPCAGHRGTRCRRTTSSVPDQVTAITSPRMSKLTVLTELVGEEDPNAAGLVGGAGVPVPATRPRPVRRPGNTVVAYRPDRIGGDQLPSAGWPATTADRSASSTTNCPRQCCRRTCVTTGPATGALMRLEPLVPQRTADLDISI